MKKLRIALLIILVMALVLSAGAVVAGYVLGANPVEIARTMQQELDARTSFRFPKLLPNTQIAAASLS
jgi:hypothetical protein